MFFQSVNRVILLMLFLSAAALAATDESTQTPVVMTTHAPNQFNEISIKLIEQGDKIDCHNINTKDKQWQKITFDRIPQRAHFCMRAWIDVEQSKLANDPTILIGMLGASAFYWDGQLIHQNGLVGTSIDDEVPGVIKTLVNIPEHNLTTGKHLLSGEVSTFHLSKELKTIGYILALVNERKLHAQILTLSILSAVFIGASLILAIIFQLIYWLYQKEIAYQIFSIFCLSSSLILATEQAKFWLDYTYDWHIFRLSLIYWFTLITSSFLPMFYVYHYHLAHRKLYTIVIILGLTAVSIFAGNYDQKSTLLFTGALLSALAINLYSMIKLNKGLVNVIIALLSLLLLYVIPDYFNELGFGMVFIFIVITMLVSLIKEMHTNKVDALKAQRIRTELLRRNMQPHFLMNCLTQLMELIEVKPKNAVEFISVLSDEFRQLTMQSAEDKTTLNEEIALCNKHLAIMSIRYQQAYELVVIGDTTGVVIPPTILHSQIENCFTHNAISSDRVFELIVQRINGKVELVLKAPIDKKIDHQGTGLGEKYIQARLAEFEQENNTPQKSKQCTFKSYEDNQYWVSEFSFLS